MNRIVAVFLLVVIAGCSGDEFPSYEQINNSLPSGGLKINYNSESSLTNIQEIQNNLDKNDADVFITSLSWYGTESNFGFDKIHNKTARELVDIVNCLKTATKDMKSNCF